VTVTFDEPEGLTGVSVIKETETEIQNKELIKITDENASSKKLTFAPTADEQTGQWGENGVQGQLHLAYSVPEVVDSPTGRVEMFDDYFVHFFHPNPNDFKRTVAKKVVFVIDTSGSMSGESLQQARQALISILEDGIFEWDSIAILSFSSTVETWEGPAELKNDMLYRATSETLQSAKTFVNNLGAGGGTNIAAGAVEGLTMLKKTEEDGVPLMVFLTDGHPTAGATRTEDILAQMRDVVADAKYPPTVVSIAFGFNLDFDLVQKMAWQHSGKAVRIYPDKDAGDQLLTVFNTIKSPLLSELNMYYDHTVVDKQSLTTTSFSTYFDGSELVVAGKLLKSDADTWDVTLDARNHNSTVHYNLTVDRSKAIEKGYDGLRRLWAYLMIKQLIKQSKTALDNTEKEQLEQQALALSLEFHFVTELTSLIVVIDDEGLAEPEYGDEGGGSGASGGNGNAARSKTIAQPFAADASAQVAETAGIRNEGGSARLGVLYSVVLLALFAHLL